MRALTGLAGRDTTELHRTSTPLELLVDLCFVVAVAQASSSLHHALAEAHISEALLGYTTVFFAIWWAWMNFTWFASAYDNDTVIYRLAVFVQIAGVLILAAGVPRAFAGNGLSVVILGYVVMRLGLVSLWLLAARGDPERRRTNRRYGVGVTVLQLGWIAMIWVPASAYYAVFLVLVVGELTVPIWAERTGVTPWHPRHIAERYGLFTIIVLGESILSITIAVQVALDAGEVLRDILPIAIGALLTVVAMWWMYFTQPVEEIVDHAREAQDTGPTKDPFIWGYGHYVIFGSAAAVGAGYAVAVDVAIHHAELSARGASLSVAIPVALYLLSVWMLHAKGWEHRPLKAAATVVAAALVLGAAAAGAPVAVTGIVLALMITFFESLRRLRPVLDRAVTEDAVPG
jgi:low temperature requirement protein LtrA